VTWTPTLSQYFIKGRRSHANDDASETTESTVAAAETKDDVSAESDAAKLLAAEEKHLSGFFLRVVNFHERWLRRALERPRLLVIFSAALIVVSYLCYNFSGSDLLPEMDEGGFVLDYLMPAGSSLTETNRVVGHVEEMLREVPEVESTSRRTGLELDLSAVTTHNRDDILAKVKGQRSAILKRSLPTYVPTSNNRTALDIEFGRSLGI
jgi:multidrug efflux pump subunit AcrB